MAKQYHQVNCSNAVLCLETQHNQYTPLQPLMMEKHYCLSDKGKVLIFINFLCLSIVSLVTPFLAFFFLTCQFRVLSFLCHQYYLSVLNPLPISWPFYIPVSFYYQKPIPNGFTKCCAIWGESPWTQKRPTEEVSPRWIQSQLGTINIQNLCFFRNREGSVGTQALKYNFILSNCFVLHMVLSCSRSKEK